MNGAESLLNTLVNSGVDICFTNPGTSEMHFVAALDHAEGMRPILCLFEGVASGAADGYARIAGKPASTLLHLGPGLGNAIANLHNARKARTPVINIVGDHATFHRQYDAPLHSDIESMARPVSGWIRSSRNSYTVAGDTADAIAAAYGPPGQVATLILPADCAWGKAHGPAPRPLLHAPAIPDDRAIQQVAETLRSGGPTALLLSGHALSKRGLLAAGRIAAATGARIFCDTFNARIERGAGIPAVERLPYFGEQVVDTLKGIGHLILVGTHAPVAFFAYPDKPSWLTPEECQLIPLATPSEDSEAGLEALVTELGAENIAPLLPQEKRGEKAEGPLNPVSLANTVACLLPEDAIVSDESNTGGVLLQMLTTGVPAHTWLALTGGAIGQGLPAAVGAALAAPDRKVLSFEADGSALYTIQSLWTMARENLDVVVVILVNRSYAILNMEFSRMGTNPGPKALEMLDLTRPDHDFVKIAEGLGVAASRANDATEFYAQLEDALSKPGPRVIEAIIS